MALALFGDDMQENWFAKLFSLSKCALHGGNIVAINGADIFQSEIFKHTLWGDDIFDALLHSMKGLVNRIADHRSLGENFFTPVEETFVTASNT